MQFQFRYTLSVGTSRGKLYIILTALQSSTFRECRSFALGHPPQNNQVHTEMMVILSWSTSPIGFSAQKRTPFQEVQFVNKILFYVSKVVWPGKPVIDIEFSRPKCGFLINSIASHFAESGVKEFSRHQLFSSDKALFKEVTVLLTVSPMQ